MGCSSEVQHLFTILQLSKRFPSPAGYWWFTSVIAVGTQEAEIRRIAVGSQPQQIVQETLTQKNSITKKGLVEWLKV
jgi:hypothetical protein